MAVTTTPTFPVEGAAVTLTATATTGERFVFEITSTPDGATPAAGLLFVPVDDSQDQPATAEAVVQAKAETATFTPSLGGDWGIKVYEFREFVAFPAFPGDPSGDARLDLVTTQTDTIEIGINMDLPMTTTAADGATLRVQVNDDTIRAASIVDTLTERSRLAALQTAVTTPLASLVGVTVSAAGFQLPSSLLNSLKTEYNDHRVLVAGPTHIAADSTNAVVLGNPDSIEGAIQVLNDIREKLIAHMTESTAAGTSWHVANTDDLTNLPLAAPAVDLATATVLFADLRERSYERHRIDVNTHTNADVTNALEAAPRPMDDVFVAFFDELADEDAAAPTGESEGLTEAVAQYGFERVT